MTGWYTAPTAIRMPVRHGAEVADDYDLSALRFVASVGEPLNPEAVVRGQEALGLPVHDNWWQRTFLEPRARLKPTTSGSWTRRDLRHCPPGFPGETVGAWFPDMARRSSS
ncbi:hypothetical protein [Actinoallomurus sp. CA-142502]|uniref:hypothetical protein n=1 Tax=Actinoallomurus sp. CA-142502 TaxID=3239885 RepID=UPI003D8B166F